MKSGRPWTVSTLITILAIPIGAILALCVVPLNAEDVTKGNGKPSSFDKLLPHIPVVPPLESLKNFRIEPGFRIELAAADACFRCPIG